jgi:hypothetical protein
MADIMITQEEADALISTMKVRISEETWNYPLSGGKISIPLISKDKKENFWLDVRRGRIDLLKGTYQNRVRQVIVLVRLDFGGSAHRNPDDREIKSPHLHLYREGYGDKWAIPLPDGVFTDTTNLMNMLGDFMHYCNITEPPTIQGGLFG